MLPTPLAWSILLTGSTLNCFRRAKLMTRYYHQYVQDDPALYDISMCDMTWYYPRYVRPNANHPLENSTDDGLQKNLQAATWYLVSRLLQINSFADSPYKFVLCIDDNTNATNFSRQTVYLDLNP